MNRNAILAVLGVGVAAFALSRYVGDDLTPQQRSVTTELRKYGFADVDVSQLSSGDLGQLDGFLNSGKSQSEIRGLVETIIRRSGDGS